LVIRENLVMENLAHHQETVRKKVQGKISYLL
jgi:hypothetical protein